MPSYSLTELNERNKIIQSQKIFWEFLHKYSINKLVNLFNDENKYSDKKISKYIDDERKVEGLDISGVNIKSFVYRDAKLKYILMLFIYKNNKEFLHLSIHFSPENFNPEFHGLIHIFKDIYNESKYTIMNPKLYALIGLIQPKENSLKFSIDYGYTSNFANDSLHDSDIQKEMNVIIKVLNKLFDEDNKEFYIGEYTNDKKEIIPIHLHINHIFENMNTHNQHTSRQNKGTRLLPQLNTNNPFINIAKDIKTKRKRIFKLKLHSKKRNIYRKTLRKRRRKRKKNMTKKRKTKLIEND